MKNATATTEEGNTTTDTTGAPGGEQEGLDERQPTESLLTGQDGEEAVDSDEVESAMLQGFKRARAEGDDTGTDDTTGTDGKKPNGRQDDQRQDDTTATQQTANTPAEGQEEDDPVVPGLGMKASEVKAKLGQMDALQKAVASANGHIGNLKQQIQNAGKGKTITKESLPKVREEFGDEYAEALAADLNAAGIGGGSAVDETTLQRMVEERTQEHYRSTERKFVKRAHPDMGDYFAGGKHHAEFAEFVNKLPAERRDEFLNTWDSDVIVPVLDEFKAQRATAETEQARQTRRIERATAPTKGGGAPVVPTVDPLEAGWNNVRGRGRGNPRVAAR